MFLVLPSRELSLECLWGGSFERCGRFGVFPPFVAAVVFAVRADG